MTSSEDSEHRICLFCTGNTCRSPMSEGILRDLLSSHSARWRVQSGGLHAFEGAPASSESVAVAREYGVDIAAHRARVFSPERARACELILVHSGEHLHRIASWGDDIAAKVFLMKAYPVAGDPGPEAWVADPIGQGVEAYRRTFLELDEVLRRIVPQIVSRAGEEE